MVASMGMRSTGEEINLGSLAPYATLPSASLGRVHAEPEGDCALRNAYQRDVGRITHSAAFRRLQYKTQFYPCVSDDSCRTRLGHTLAVSQIARTIARALGANEDLTEAIALVHDVGHAPFGHVGEDVLNEFMTEECGFEHNANGLRVVDLLEHRSPEYQGLNLTYEVREGLARHQTEHDQPDAPAEFVISPSPSIEAQIVDIADPIAYRCHDIEDGLLLGLLKLDELGEEGPAIWRSALKGLDVVDDPLPASVVAARRLINALVVDVVTATRARISGSDVRSVHDIRNCAASIVGYSPEVGQQDLQMADFLVRRLYHHPFVLRQRKVIEEVLRTLLQTALFHPSQLRTLGHSCGKRLSICDAVAAMTDRAVVCWFDDRFPERRAQISELVAPQINRAYACEWRSPTKP